MRFATLISLILLSVATFARSADYDPLRATKPDTRPVDLTVRDEKRARDIPIRVYLPADKTPAAVVLFSHGLGGNRNGPAYLGEHWSARGYAVVHLQHLGSDDSVWKDVPAAQRLAAMQKAASGQNLFRRIADVPAVLDQLESWNKTASHTLAGRLDLSRVGMSGHSFGAVTTQAVGGQQPAAGKSPTDARIKAAVMMSPSPPRAGKPGPAFGVVKIPWLLLTGTHDDSPVGDITPADRRLVYPALPAGDKYELVLDGAQHSAFSDQRLRAVQPKRNPNHHRAILAISTAFWDAHLKGDDQAKQWLQGPSVRSVLEPKDEWQRK